ncbi:MAG TPA: hypothetical protein VGX96_05905 [Candidatus Elarobacter sp.]|nr:hypothetical protein [Candidatus Elarobacter sp.]
MRWEEVAEFALGAQRECNSGRRLEATVAPVFKTLECGQRDPRLSGKVDLAKAHGKAPLLGATADRFAEFRRGEKRMVHI